MNEDIVRVLRVLEYVGPRSAVEENLKRSWTGTRNGCLDRSRTIPCTITAVTLTQWPEVLERARDEFVVEVPELGGEKGPAPR